jgi:circadian clock protein KaiC
MSEQNFQGRVEVTKKNIEKNKLKKCLTGIQGLDELTNGGLPANRITLVCGAAGCGKTLLGMEFLVRGAMNQNEPGVFISFEENKEELEQNVSSLGWDISRLTQQKLILIDYIYIERNEIEVSGEYDLEGLFIRLGNAIDSIGAKRIVIDTIEVLFSSFSNMAILRAEIRRLFRWLKQKGVTAIVTGEKGEKMLTRYGLEEYVSDCVIEIVHNLENQIATRRIRIVKYRGSVHGTNDYPFLIDENGISVIPITSITLDHKISIERVATGITRLDAMLEGKGYFRGSSILISGTAGSGKTSVACSFVNAACARGERCLYFAFEESNDQIVRNMKSIGINLEQWIKNGSLAIHATRPSHHGVEAHLAQIIKVISAFKPQVVIIDPITNLIASGSDVDVNSMLTRLIDYLKKYLITMMCTNLTGGGNAFEATDAGISSVIDSWLLLRDVELGGERNRVMYILKSRGMSHSNQMREFLITDKGLDLLDVYLGSEGVLTGTARFTQIARMNAAEKKRMSEINRLQTEIERKRKTMDARISLIRDEYESTEAELNSLLLQERILDEESESDQKQIGRLRRSD